MGLDMYLKGRKWVDTYAHQRTKVDGYTVTNVQLQIGYWRKHPDLHGYIIKHFSGGFDDCKPIELSSAELRQIAKAIRSGELPKTEGPFFGNSEVYQASVDYDATVFERAADWIDSAPLYDHIVEYEGNW
jgi:hypothetical protein